MLFLAFLYALAIPLNAAAQSAAAKPDAGPPSQDPNTSTLLIKFQPGAASAQRSAAISQGGGKQLKEIPALNLHVVEVPGADKDAAKARYLNNPNIIRVDDNRSRRAETIPSDVRYPSQWALPKIGWDLVYGTVTPSGSAKVALLDTGVDATHTELFGKVVPGTSILDGTNGMTDPSGHGTWLAGIIAANTNDVTGIAGVAFAGVSVMPVTVLNSQGLGQDSDEPEFALPPPLHTAPRALRRHRVRPLTPLRTGKAAR